MRGIDVGGAKLDECVHTKYRTMQLKVDIKLWGTCGIDSRLALLA